MMNSIDCALQSKLMIKMLYQPYFLHSIVYECLLPVAFSDTKYSTVDFTEDFDKAMAQAELIESTDDKEYTIGEIKSIRG